MHAMAAEDCSRIIGNAIGSCSMAHARLIQSGCRTAVQGTLNEYIRRSIMQSKEGTPPLQGDWIIHCTAAQSRMTRDTYLGKGLISSAPNLWVLMAHAGKTKSSSDDEMKGSPIQNSEYFGEKAAWLFTSTTSSTWFPEFVCIC